MMTDFYSLFSCFFFPSAGRLESRQLLHLSRSDWHLHWNFCQMHSCVCNVLHPVFSLWTPVQLHSVLTGKYVSREGCIFPSLSSCYWRGSQGSATFLLPTYTQDSPHGAVKNVLTGKSQWQASWHTQHCCTLRFSYSAKKLYSLFLLLV